MTSFQVLATRKQSPLSARNQNQHGGDLAAPELDENSRSHLTAAAEGPSGRALHSFFGWVPQRDGARRELPGLGQRGVLDSWNA
jgi:hypothetical protein